LTQKGTGDAAPFAHKIEARGDVGVIGAERLLPDRWRAFEARLGVGIAALSFIQRGEELRTKVGDGMKG
jgi:hypothetical protein